MKLYVQAAICLSVACLLGAAAVNAQKKAPPNPPAKAPAAAPEWPQWGGPQRNFKASSGNLADTWLGGKPKQLWSRKLGEGHSSILADNGRLITMYAGGERETVVALDAADGKTVWEYGYDGGTRGLNFEYGRGPHSTPLIVGELVYAVGAAGKMHALDKRTGRVVWQHDLKQEFGGNVDGRGYAPSPIAYRDTVIVPVGGAGQWLMAFERRSGNVVWKSGDFTPAPGSPILINVGGQEQLVAFGSNEVAAVDPTNGTLLWSHPHKTDYGLNLSTPVWGADGLLFMSSAYGTGSRVLQLTRNGNQTTVKQLWASSRMRVHFGTAIRVGDFVYGSSGDFGPAFFTAVNVKTGQIAWQDRALARASFLYADGKFVILDEDGTLAIATAFPAGLSVQAKAQVMNKTSWTVPTLTGTKLYVRDRGTIAALELG